MNTEDKKELTAKSVNDMTREEIENVPHLPWAEVIEFDSLIILPMEEIHDSDYRIMDFVAVREDKPIARLSGCSDVLHINGIGGVGADWLTKYGGYPKAIPPVDWSIDCLKVSGLLRLFCSGMLKSGRAVSSFEVFYNSPRNSQPTIDTAPNN